MATYSCMFYLKEEEEEEEEEEKEKEGGWSRDMNSVSCCLAAMF